MKNISDLFFPKRCCSCKRLLPLKTEEFMCDRCKLFADYEPAVASALPYNKLITVFVYTGSAAKTVKNMKQVRFSEAIEFAAGEMLKRIEEEIKDKADTVTFVPRFTKGKNPPYCSSKIIAEKIARKLECEYGLHTLKKIKNNGSQTMFKTPEERKRNVIDTFAAEGDVRDKTVIVIDDVRTTGATLLAVGKVLKDAGAKNLYAVTLAARTATPSKSKIRPLSHNPKVTDFKEHPPIRFSELDKDVERLHKIRAENKKKAEDIESVLK